MQIKFSLSLQNLIFFKVDLILVYLPNDLVISFTLYKLIVVG